MRQYYEQFKRWVYEPAASNQVSSSSPCFFIFQSNSDETTSTTDDDEEESKKVLERQISTLSTVSSEEKIAVWIQSAPEGEEMITHSET